MSTMNWRLYIPYTNDFDTFLKCYNSIADDIDPRNIEIVYNGGPENRKEYLNSFTLEWIRRQSYCWEACYNVSLPFSCVMNVLQQNAEMDHLDFYLWAHSDCLVKNNAASRLVEYIHNIEDRQSWGVVFTFYDILCGVNMHAVRAVGPWDQRLYQYFADNDWYHRVRLAGFSTLDSGLGADIEHMNGGSNTLKKSSVVNQRANYCHHGLQEQYYIAKWGGRSGHETYNTPFNI